MYGKIERQRVTTRRAALLIGGKLLIASILAGRMYQLQVVRSERYKLQADGNRVRIRPLAPARGRILDRFGAALAVNREIFRVLLIPERAVDTGRTLDALDRLIDLTDDEKADALRQAARSKAFTPIAVRRGPDWHQVARIEVNAPDLPGVVIDVEQVREYPHSIGTAHILGYVGAASGAEIANAPLLAHPGFHVGKSGIEKTRDSVLRGKPGTRQVEVNAFGREVRDLSIRASEPGGDVRLTLDVALQDFAVARLARHRAAAAVLMGVAAGDVLAMASTPGFEPNQFSEGIRADVWKSVNSAPLSPMLNRAVSGLYAPGSTFKMVVALAALEAGIVAPRRRVECRGFTTLGKMRFHCWRRRGHGWVDMVQAIERSCDVYFYDIAARTGIDRIAAMARRLGLGARLLGELPGESAGLMPTPGWKKKRHDARWHKGDTLNVGIGQGAVLATPLQLAAMTARLASGRAVVPRLTLGGPEPDFPPLGLSDAGLRTIRRSMEAVANARRGTAFRYVVREEGFALAGKTGTSQVRRTTRRERERGILENHERPWRERDHALFVAYAPLAAPRYAIAVVVEHGGGGSAVAAPVASGILREAMRRDPLAEDADGPAFAALPGGRG